MPRTKKKSSREIFRDTLQMISPGTVIRDSISMILQSRTGAMLCFGEPQRLAHLSEGGVKLDAPCTAQLLYELAKMDGAIILNSNGSRILFANRFMKPAATRPSDETGTRHRAAERIARQARCVVIAVSERRSSVTLYVHDIRHILEAVPTVINKAMQAIQTLEKYVKNLEQALQDLSTREFQEMVTIFDVCRAVQRAERIRRIAQEIEPRILELGTEGRLIRLQLQEVLMPLDEAYLVARDYYREKGGLSYDHVRSRLADLSQQDLLDLNSIGQAMGYGSNLRSIDTYLTPRGYRVLTATHRLSPQIVENLVGRFGSLQQIVRAPKEELVAVDGVGEVLAERVRVGLNLLRSQLAMDLRKDAFPQEL